MGGGATRRADRGSGPWGRASGDWTCSIAHFTGHMNGPMAMADGSSILPTGKPFEVDFCTVALWDNGQIVEDNLMYDLVTFMKQIGLSG
jgi:hypothetical protein